MTSLGKPVYFGPDERPLVGWLNLPEGEVATCGVVMAGPIGMEEFGAQPALAHLQSRCHAEGLASLKFDYDGTGDSAGFWSDPGRWDAWTRSVGDAVAFMREVGAPRIVLVGLHLGGLILAKAAAECHVDGLVLWEPVLTGRAFLRQQQLLLASILNKPTESTAGVVEGPLFAFDHETVASLRQSRLDKGDVPETCPTLVISRAGSVPSDLAKVGWEADSAEAISEASPIGEYPNPYRTPTEDVETIIAWIEASVSQEQAVVAPKGASSCRIVVDPDRPPIVERPVWIGDVPLFGIVAQPEHWEGRNITVVLLTTGIWTHVGTGHMWSRLSREWASLGVRVLRVDISGVGPSGVREGQPRQVSLSPYVVEDCHQIADFLGSPTGSDLVFAGSSMGGYHALGAGLELFPKALLLANPTLGSMLPLGEFSSRSAAGNRAYPAVPWLIPRLAVRHRRTAILIWRTLSEIFVNFAYERPIAAVARRGTQVFMLSSTDEHDLLYGNRFWTYMLNRCRREGMLVERVFEGMDHGFFTSWQREALRDTLTEWVIQLASTEVPQSS